MAGLLSAYSGVSYRIAVLALLPHATAILCRALLERAKDDVALFRYTNAAQIVVGRNDAQVVMKYPVPTNRTLHFFLWNLFDFFL